MKDYPNIGERAWALLNGQLDGELSGSELLELDALLAGSEELRNAQAELNGLNHCLQNLPEKAPPAYLHNAITSTVRMPLKEGTKNSKRGFFASLTETWLGPVFALTAGVLLTVGIYETNFEEINATDMSNMSGSMINTGPAVENELLDSFNIDEPNTSGSAQLYQSGRDYLINVQIDSDHLALFTVTYADINLQFMGMNSDSNPVDGLMVSDQKVAVEGMGDQQYTLVLRSPDAQLPTDSAPLKIGLSVNHAQPIEAELKVVKNN